MGGMRVKKVSEIIRFRRCGEKKSASQGTAVLRETGRKRHAGFHPMMDQDQSQDTVATGWSK